MIPRSIVWQRAEQESSYCNEKVIWLFITKPLPPELQFLFTDILLITLSQADRCPLLCAGRNKRTPFEGVTFERSVSRFGIVSGREPGGCRSRFSQLLQGRIRITSIVFNPIIGIYLSQPLNVMSNCQTFSWYQESPLPLHVSEFYFLSSL